MKRLAGYLGTFTAFFSSGVFATPIVLPSAPSLLKDANVVVVGRVESNTNTGHGSDSRGAVSLAVDRVLQQAGLVVGSRISYEYSYADPNAAGPVRDSYGVFFLSCSANGACRPASVAMHFASARPEPAHPGRLTGSTLDLVAAEMVNVIEHPQSTVSARTNAVRELSDIPLTLPLRDELVDVARRGDVGARLAASAVLLSHGDTSTVELITPEVITPPAGWDSLVSLIASNVRDLKVSGAGAPATWSPWLRSANVEVRRGAASVLSRMRTKESATLLARQALDDRDNDVLFYTVSSLILTIGDSRHPTMDRFDTDPEFYRKRWQAWRAKNLN